MIQNPVVQSGGAETVVLHVQNKSNDSGADPMLYVYYTDGSEENKLQVVYIGGSVDLEVSKNSFIYSYVMAMGSVSKIQSYSGAITSIGNYVYFVSGEATIAVLA